MNKLQALLIAGLLSLTSVSFASSVSYLTGGYTGQVTLTSDDTDFAFGISFDDTKTQYFELTNVGPNEKYLSIGDSIKTGTPLSTAPVTLSLYSDSAFTNLLAGGVTNSFQYLFAIGTQYYLKAVEDASLSYSSSNISVSAVPVPAAGILFASALFGAGALGRRKKKAKASVVGAFARAS